MQNAFSIGPFLLNKKKSSTTAFSQLPNTDEQSVKVRRLSIVNIRLRWGFGGEAPSYWWQWGFGRGAPSAQTIFQQNEVF